MNIVYKRISVPIVTIYNTLILKVVYNLKKISTIAVLQHYYQNNV